MSVVGWPLTFTEGAQRTRPAAVPALALAIALILHAAMGAALVVIDPTVLWKKEAIIEMQVEERKPPPPELKPEPEPPPPPPEPPRVVPRRMAAAERIPRPAPEPPAPPPPNQEAPPSDAPPVFGVTMSSVVSGEAGMAVPVGNTLMTKNRKSGPPGETKPYAATGAKPFVPVSDVYIARMPKTVREVNSIEVYPEDARRMGIEGRVTLKIGIDENGDVKEVKVVGKAGHGFDEAARDAMRKFKFTPALTSDGKAVPCRITYTFTFEVQ